MLLHEKAEQVQSDKTAEANKKIEAQPISVQPMNDEPSQMLPPPGGELKEEELGEELVENEDKDSKILEVLNELVDLLKSKTEEKSEEPDEESEEESPIDDYKEEKEDELDEEVTPDEFGMDIDQALATKETDKEATKEEDDKEDKEDKKEEMKEEKASVTAASDKMSETLSDEFNKDQSDKNQYKQNVVTPQITKVKEDEIPEMFKLSNVVLEFEGTNCNLKDANDESVSLYTMDIGSENDPEREQFATDFIYTAKKNGINEALKKFNAKKVDSLKEKDPKKIKEITKLNDEIPADTLFDVKKIAENEYKLRHKRAQKLVWTAMNKNLLLEGNPLKEALLEKLSSCNMDEKQALEAIEIAFASAADNYFSIQTSKIDEYLSMTDESFLQWENVVTGSNIRIPEIEVDASSLMNEHKTPKQKAKDTRKRAAKGSLPISTQSSSSAEEDYRNKLLDAMPKPANFGNALKVKK